MSKRDAEQVEKVLAGDQAAYEPLVEAYQGRIFAFVAGRIRDFSATEDMESTPQDSLVKIVYWIPETVYQDSVFVELICANVQGMIVAKPVNKTQAPGSYTAFLSKRGLPDGIYFVQLKANRSQTNVQVRKLNLIWTDRK